MSIINTIRSWFVKEKPKEIIDQCLNDCPVCGALLISNRNKSIFFYFHCPKFHYTVNNLRDRFRVYPYEITRFSSGETEIWKDSSETDEIIIDLPYILSYNDFSSVEKIKQILMLL